MKFIKLTKFKTNPELLIELADKISGNVDKWQTLDYTQYPSIMQMLSDNNLINIREINISTRVGPLDIVALPLNVYGAEGDRITSPFRVFIPLGGVSTTYTIGDESVVVDSPVVAIATEEMRATIPAGASYMLRILIKDAETIGINRFVTDPEHKMTSFVKFFGLA